MNQIQVPSPAVLSVANLVPQIATTVVTVVQSSPVIYYSMPAVKFLLPRKQKHDSFSGEGVLSIYEGNEEDKNQNFTDDWTSIVEKRFSLSEFVNDSDLDEVRQNGLEEEIVTPPQCNCEPISNNPTYYSQHEGMVKIWTAGGNMHWFRDPVLPTRKKRRALDEISSKCSIKRVDIKIAPTATYYNASTNIFVDSLSRAMNDILSTGIFTDWLLLKCEVTGLEFSSLNGEVTIHSVSSLSNLKKAVENNSCLPLPFVMKRNETNLYFYFVFNYNGNPKIPKLNDCLFFRLRPPSSPTSNANDDQNCGIQISDSYIAKENQYIFHCNGELTEFLKQNEFLVKKLILHHIVWGFLQIWVRKIVKLCRNMLTTDEVARQLLICHVEPTGVPDLKDTANRSQTFYLLGFCEERFLYLKFFSLNPGQTTEYSFSQGNLETDFVSEIPIIQYFRQYFYINVPKRAAGVENIVVSPVSDKNLLESGLFSIAKEESNVARKLSFSGNSKVVSKRKSSKEERITSDSSCITENVDTNSESDILQTDIRDEDETQAVVEVNSCNVNEDSSTTISATTSTTSDIITGTSEDEIKSKEIYSSVDNGEKKKDETAEADCDSSSQPNVSTVMDLGINKEGINKEVNINAMSPCKNGKEDQTGGFGSQTKNSLGKPVGRTRPIRSTKLTNFGAVANNLDKKGEKIILTHSKSSFEQIVEENNSLEKEIRVKKTICSQEADSSTSCMVTKEVEQIATAEYEDTEKQGQTEKSDTSQKPSKPGETDGPIEKTRVEICDFSISDLIENEIKEVFSAQSNRFNEVNSEGGVTTGVIPSLTYDNINEEPDSTNNTVEKEVEETFHTPYKSNDSTVEKQIEKPVSTPHSITKNQKFEILSSSKTMKNRIGRFGGGRWTKMSAVQTPDTCTRGGIKEDADKVDETSGTCLSNKTRRKKRIFSTSEIENQFLKTYTNENTDFPNNNKKNKKMDEDCFENSPKQKLSECVHTPKSLIKSRGRGKRGRWSYNSGINKIQTSDSYTQVENKKENFVQKKIENFFQNRYCSDNIKEENCTSSSITGKVTKYISEDANGKESEVVNGINVKNETEVSTSDWTDVTEGDVLKYSKITELPRKPRRRRSRLSQINNIQSVYSSTNNYVKNCENSFDTSELKRGRRHSMKKNTESTISECLSLQFPKKVDECISNNSTMNSSLVSATSEISEPCDEKNAPVLKIEPNIENVPEGIVRIILNMVSKEFDSAEVLPTLRNLLDKCCRESAMDLTKHNKTNDPQLMKDRFNEVLQLTDQTKGLEMFIRQIFVFLQLDYTTRSCIKLMDEMIFEKVRMVVDPTNMWEKNKQKLKQKKVNSNFTEQKYSENDLRKLYQIKPCYVRLDRMEILNYYRTKTCNISNVFSLNKVKQEPEEDLNDDNSSFRDDLDTSIFGSDGGTSLEISDVRNVSEEVSVCLPRVEDLVYFTDVADSWLSELGKVKQEIDDSETGKEGLSDVSPRKKILIKEETLPRGLKRRKNLSESTSLEFVTVGSETAALLWNWKNKRRKIE